MTSPDRAASRLERLLEAVLEPSQAEVIGGDLRETLIEESESLGPVRARWRYRVQVARAILTGFARRLRSGRSDAIRGAIVATLVVLSLQRADLNGLSMLILALGGLVVWLRGEAMPSFGARRGRAFMMMMGFFGGTLVLELIPHLARGRSFPQPLALIQALLLISLLCAVLAPIAAALSSRRGIWLLPCALMPSLVWVGDLRGLFRGPALERIQAVGFPMTARFGPEAWGLWNVTLDITFWVLCATVLALIADRQSDSGPKSAIT